MIHRTNLMFYLLAKTVAKLKDKKINTKNDRKITDEGVCDQRVTQHQQNTQQSNTVIQVEMKAATTISFAPLFGSLEEQRGEFTQNEIHLVP